jgi:hypothetical protein
LNLGHDAPPDQAGAQTDKSKRDQDGSAYHQPMRILHCGESAQLVRLTYSPSVATSISLDDAA